MTETKKSTTGALRQKPAQPEVRALKTYAERLASGKALRDACPRSAHADWKELHDRPDPIRLVLKADEGRVPELLPLRHGRMALSPFTFYRGSALAAFSVAYADQNEKDHAALKRAIRRGKVKAAFEETP
jgi:hypothetical protein